LPPSGKDSPAISSSSTTALNRPVSSSIVNVEMSIVVRIAILSYKYFLREQWRNFATTLSSVIS
jgi:hypothetical protein